MLNNICGSVCKGRVMEELELKSEAISILKEPGVLVLLVFIVAVYILGFGVLIGSFIGKLLA